DGFPTCGAYLCADASPRKGQRRHRQESLRRFPPLQGPRQPQDERARRAAGWQDVRLVRLRTQQGSALLRRLAQAHRHDQHPPGVFRGREERHVRSVRLQADGLSPTLRWKPQECLEAPPICRCLRQGRLRRRHCRLRGRRPQARIPRQERRIPEVDQVFTVLLVDRL
ncbi:hypothetical protein PFISCL1PPCAC_28560, partial [Pristionchus fissidentatus]